MHLNLWMKSPTLLDGTACRRRRDLHREGYSTHTPQSRDNVGSGLYAAMQADLVHLDARGDAAICGGRAGQESAHSPDSMGRHEPMCLGVLAAAIGCTAGWIWSLFPGASKSIRDR